MALARRALPAEEDLVTLTRTIYSYRFLTFQQLRRLHPGINSADLNLAVRTRHIAAIKRPTMRARTPELVYALDRAGADLLTDVLAIDRAQLKWRAHRNLIGLLFLEHRLAANEVRIAMTLGAPRVGGELVHWYNEPSIEEDVVDPVEGVPPMSFRPDAYLRLRFADGHVLNAFLEVDRSSESYARIAAKVRRYLVYKEHRLFRSSVGARSFRVLSTVPSQRRLDALKRVIEEAGGRRMFWLTRAADVGELNLEAPVWSVAGTDAVASLFHRVAPSELLPDIDLSP
jgi:hypothetical protein